MARMIDADALIKYCKRTVQIADELKELNIKKTFSAMLNLVLTQPTIDAVPVIRCKDCKHHGEQYGNGYCMKDGCYGWSDEDYCSRAERKETS